MKNKNKKLVSFLLSLAYIGLSLAGFDFVNTDTTYAFADISINNIGIDCENDTQYCTQEHTNDCENCEANSNHCHSIYLLPLMDNFDLFNFNISPQLRDGSRFKNLSYTPKSPPS